MLMRGLSLFVPLFLALFTASPALAGPRVVSINMCTDELLLDLAPAHQIAGLSPFARQAVRAGGAQRLAGLQILSGTAEEIIVIKPDLVVSSSFMKRETRAILRGQGVALHEFNIPRSVAEVKAEITRFGALTGNPEAAAARVADIDMALGTLRAAALGRALRVLPLARRGWAEGPDTILSDILAQAGLANAAAELGLRHGGFVGLEAIVKLRPDAVLLSQEGGVAEDQGRAMLLHPAVAQLFPPERRILLPDHFTVCGGPSVAEAMRVLARQINHLTPRPPARS
jgi:iron complex transport system substrate-binding protein